MSNIKLPALKDALDLLNQTQEVLGRFVSNHRNPSEKDTISELLGMHDCAAGYAARKAVSDTLALLADRERQAGEAVAYTPGEWFDATTVDLMEAFFRSRLPAIREAAKEHGYAIGVHGSLRRDLDLIAAPWRDGASDADTLADAIQNAACGIHIAKHQWEQKPAGRVATSMPICWTHRQGVLSDGHIDLSVLASLPAPQAVQAGWKLVPVEPTDEMETAAENDYEQRGETFPDWKSKWRAMTAAAPSPDGKAEQAEAPSDSTLKLAEMILSDCGHSTAISTRLRDRVAERIERHIATQPTASPEQAEALKQTPLSQSEIDAITFDGMSLSQLVRAVEHKHGISATQPTASNAGEREEIKYALHLESAVNVGPVEQSEDTETAVLRLDTFRPVRLEFGVTMHRDVIPNDFGWIKRDDVLTAIRAALASKPPAGDDCAGGSPCTNCPDKKKCQCGCVRQPEFVSQKSIAQDDCDTVDKLLSGLGLDPERCRTEGGALNVGRVLSLLQDGCSTNPPAGEQKPVLIVTVTKESPNSITSDVKWLRDFPEGETPLYLGPQLEQVAQDSDLLDWLLMNVSGAEFRRIGVNYSGDARREDVRAARARGEVKP